MIRTILSNRNMKDILTEDAFEKWSWSMDSVFLVCTETGFYFQIEDFDDNALAVCATAKELNKFFEEADV